MIRLAYFVLYEDFSYQLHHAAKYMRVEMKPPGLEEFPQIKQSISNILVGAKTRKFMKMPVKEVWLNTLVCAEIGCLFFVGEIVGKGTTIGYFIPGAWSVHGEDSRGWAYPYHELPE